MSREVTCHHLFNFYRHVAPQIRVSDSLVPGLQRQLATLDAAGLAGAPIQVPDRYPHPLPASVVQALLHAQIADAQHNLYHDLVGSRLPIAEIRRSIQEAGLPELLPKVSRFKITEHAPAYFGVMADTVRLCGYKGWLILIDEVELIGRLGKVSRMQAYRNLHWLLNWSDAMPYPIYAVAAAATSLQQIWTQERGRLAPDQIVIPELAEQRVSAQAGSELQSFFRIALDPQRSLTLQWISRQTILEMLQKVIALHGAAHGWAAPQDPAWARQITAGLKDDTKLRTWIRLVLEALDLQLVIGVGPTLEPAALAEPVIEPPAESSTADAS